MQARLRRGCASSKSSSRRRSICCRAPFAPATRFRRPWAWWPTSCRRRSGPEFKKSFDQQNFGLPLRDALNELADARRAVSTCSFFVTAVLIQRETGGNLAEILDNLAHVVRERFKILPPGPRCTPRTAALPATCCSRCRRALAWRSMFINPDLHADCCFSERMGQMLLVGAMVHADRSDSSGSAHVIKIEV